MSKTRSISFAGVMVLLVLVFAQVWGPGSAILPEAPPELSHPRSHQDAF